jgi:hypothetical protein
MSTKQILLSAFALSIIGSFGINAKNTEKQSTSSNNTPSLICFYTLIQTNCYGPQATNTNIQFIKVDKDILNQLKEMGKENDFTICPSPSPKLPKKIKIYNPTDPFENEKCDVCAYFNDMVLNFSTEEHESFIDYLHSTK